MECWILKEIKEVLVVPQYSRIPISHYSLRAGGQLCLPAIALAQARRAGAKRTKFFIRQMDWAYSGKVKYFRGASGCGIRCFKWRFTVCLDGGILLNQRGFLTLLNRVSGSIVRG